MAGSYIAKNYRMTSKDKQAQAKIAQNNKRNTAHQQLADKTVLTAPSFKVARNRTDT